jgi:hypothetical protein
LWSYTFSSFRVLFLNWAGHIYSTTSLGNHDELSSPEALPGNVHVLDGQVAHLSGLLVGGVSGIVGDPQQHQRRTEDTSSIPQRMTDSATKAFKRTSASATCVATRSVSEPAPTSASTSPGRSGKQGLHAFKMPAFTTGYLRKSTHPALNKELALIQSIASKDSGNT